MTNHLQLDNQFQQLTLQQIEAVSLQVWQVGALVLMQRPRGSPAAVAAVMVALTTRARSQLRPAMRGER